jgi:hypothetical protein
MSGQVIRGAQAESRAPQRAAHCGDRDFGPMCPGGKRRSTGLLRPGAAGEIGIMGLEIGRTKLEQVDRHRRVTVGKTNGK